MSNLPDGVTQASIDRAYGSGYSSRTDDTWGGLFDCEHEDAIDQEWERIEQQPGFDGEHYESVELTRLQTAKQEFWDNEVLHLSVSYHSAGATVFWTCPVCAGKHEDEYDMEYFAPDPD